MLVTASETKAPRHGLWPLAPLGVALLAAGLAAIDSRRSFTLAEAETVVQSRHGWRGLVPVWHADASGSLYLVFLKGWLHAGSAEWIGRVPSIVAVGLTAAVVYALGARLADRATGLAAGVVFAASAFTVGAGRSVEPLAFALLGAALATWLFVLAVESGRPVLWGVYAIVAAAAVYTHASCAFVLVAHAVALLFAPRSNLRAATVAGLVIAVLALPAVVQVLAEHRHVIDALDQPTLRDTGRAVHDAAGRNVVLIALALTGAAAIFFRPATRVEAWKGALLATWAAAPLPFLLTLSIARPSLDERYLAVATPALALLAGVALARLFRREAALALAAAVLVLAAVRIVQLERSETENWRAATAYALSARSEGDRIVVVPARALTAFGFYAGPNLGSLTPGGPTSFVVVRALDPDAGVDAARRAARAPAYALRGERRFGDHLGVEQWDRTGLPPR